MILFFLSLLSGCSKLFFYPHRQFYENFNLFLYKYEDVYFYTKDGVMLHGWFFPSKENKATVLFFHGNAENISTHINNVLWLINNGYNVFAIDYRGYGKSQGNPSIEGVHIDAEAAINRALNFEKAHSNIIIYGQSLGGSVAITVTAKFKQEDRIKAIIIESPFAGYRMIAQEKLSNIMFLNFFKYLLSYLISDNFSPEKNINELAHLPKLFLHGKKDNIVPYHHSQLLFEKAKEPKILIILDDAGHINVSKYGNVRNVILNFIDFALKEKRH